MISAPVIFFALLGAGVHTCPPRAVTDLVPGPFYPAGLISVRDRNGDGTADILHVRYKPLPDTIYVVLYPAVLLGNPDGNFGLCIESPAFFYVPSWELIEFNAAEADLNADGIEDLVFRVGKASEVYLLEGLDGLRFASRGVQLLPPQKILASGIAGRSFVGDVNGDGIDDVITHYAVVAGPSPSRLAIWVFFGNRDGPPIFFEWEFTDYFPEGSSVIHSTAGDFNGDGLTDIALIAQKNPFPDTEYLIAVAYAAPGGFEEGPPIRFGGRASVLRSADMNGDGFDDLIFTAGGVEGDPFFVAFSNGDKTFTVRSWRLADILPCLSQVKAAYASISPVADLNGDGLPDFLTTRKRFTVLVLGDRQGDLKVIPHNGVPGSLPYEAAYDVNGDGYVDLIGTGAAASCRYFQCSFLAVTYGNEALSFGILPRLKLFEDYRLPPKTLPSFQADDLDSDGLPDILVLLQYGRQVRVFWGLEEPFLFQERSPLVLDSAAADIETVDVTGDGLRDVVSSDPGTGHLLLFRNEGARRFSRHYLARNLPEPGALTVADFNEDGVLDIAVICRAKEQVWILAGTPGGNYEPIEVLSTGRGPIDLTNADFNRDGQKDLAVLCHLERTVSTYLGSGNGKFKQEGSYPVGHGPTILRGADFNGDGLPDVVTCNRESADVSVLIRASGGGFEEERRWDLEIDPGWYHHASKPLSLAVLDYNADGHLDVAVTFFAWAGGDHGTPGFCMVFGKGDGTSAGARWYLADTVMDTWETCPSSEWVAVGAIRSIVPWDWDRDGAVDLAFYGLLSGTIFFLRNVSPCAQRIASFRRGEINQDRRINIADAVALLAYLFSGGALDCRDAGDVNDDGVVNIADPVRLLGHLFGAKPPPPAPFEACGSDGPGDTLRCRRFDPHACPEDRNLGHAARPLR